MRTFIYGIILHIPHLLYPNYLSINFFIKGWGLFFREEVYNLSVLTGLVFLWHCFIPEFTIMSVAFHVAMVIGFRRFVAGGLCTSTKRLDGQTVIITGANVGIGKETAKDLLRRGAHVILACRNLQKAEAAHEELCRISQKIEVRRLDLSSLQSIRQFVGGIIKDKIKLHILINNAGVLSDSKYSETSDGFELHMGTNHLGHFLLTNLLLPQMKHGEPARIVTLTSNAHYGSHIHFDDLNQKDNYENIVCYGNSKLANILFSRQLAKRLKGNNIQVFALHPGGVETNIARNIVNYKTSYLRLRYLFMKTTLEGAQTTIHCVTDATQHLEMYLSDCAVGWASKDAKDDAIANKLWDLSAQLVGLDI